MADGDVRTARRKARVFVLIPVHNRLAGTRALLTCLRAQKGVEVRLVVADDGSTDGTWDYLRRQGDVLALRGSGQWWWAGAMHHALREIRPLLWPGDFFAFMNNDTLVRPNFLATLVRVSEAHGRSPVGSVVRAAEPPHELLDVGPRADLDRFAVWDILRDLPEAERRSLQPVYEVDFLPGRGTLYPGEVLDRVGGLHPRLLPHYYADYEFSDRVRRAGWRLLVSSEAVTYSTEAFGNSRCPKSFLRRHFGKGSPANVVHRALFFSMVGTPRQRVTAVPRLWMAALDRRWHVVAIAARRFVVQPVRGRIGGFRAHVRQKGAGVRSVARDAFGAVLGTVRSTKLGAISTYVERWRAAVPELGWTREAFGMRAGRVLRRGFLARMKAGIQAGCSGRVRARALAALARLDGRRPMVLQACCAGMLQDLRGRRVLLCGRHGRRLRPVFALLGASVEEETAVTGGAFDLVFCAASGPLAPEVLGRLWRRVRPGGWLYCTRPPGGCLPEGQAVAALVRAGPVLEGSTDELHCRLPDGGLLHPGWFGVGRGAPPVRILAFRRPETERVEERAESGGALVGR